jgi:hypothetical protein
MNEGQKIELTNAAQTVGASPSFDAFWADVEAELIRMNPDLTIEPKTTT